MVHRSLKRPLAGGVLAAALAGCGALGDGTLPDVPYFGQAQSTLEEFGGMPLVVANWDGRFRPYVYDGAYRPLVDEAAVRTRVELRDLDLLNPIPLSESEVLLGGTFSGKPDFDLLLFDAAAGTLHNLTATPGTDEGGTCAHPQSRAVSYSDGGRQVFATVAPASGDGAPALERRETSGAAPPLARCVFVDAGTLVGVQPQERAVYRCTLGGRVSCERTLLLDPAVQVGTLFRNRNTGRVGVIALAAGERFRRPYAFSDDFRSLEVEPAASRIEGDVVEFDGGLLRRGLHSRYQVSGHEDTATSVFRVRAVGGRLFAVAADARSPRTLAVWEGGGWRLLPHREAVAAGSDAGPMEVWIRSEDGRVHQAFYFGPRDTRKVVLWWHGGPRENVSPRFNPYYRALAERGYGVLAVNYPGSTGRGREYEELGEGGGEAVRASVRAALRYLEENGVEEVLSWSVSAGAVPQRYAALEARGLRAVVDQVGVPAEEMRAAVAARRIPYFDVRGRYDRAASSRGARFVYEGGHDITTAGQFAAMLSALDEFLASTPRTRFRGVRGAPAAPAVVLDAGHVGNARDPNRVNGISEAELAFGIARHVADRCLEGADVLLTRSGDPMLEPPDRSLRRRVGMVAATQGVPFLSFHFNASTAGAAYPNSSSVFVGAGSSGRSLEFARALVRSLRAAGVPPQLRYGPEIPGLVTVEAGIFERGLALLAPPHRSARALVEVAYYDHPDEHRRLAEVALGDEGEPVRPRLLELATALCPAFEELRRPDPA